MTGQGGDVPEHVGSWNAFVIAFAEDGKPVALLVRSDGALTLTDDRVEFRALCLDGISFPSG